MISRSQGREVLFLSSAALVLVFGSGLGSSSVAGEQKGKGTESVSRRAYFEVTRDRGEPLRLPLTANEDASWPSLVFFEYSGPKTRVSIGGVETDGRKQACGLISARPIEDWLAASIFQTGRFEIVGSTVPIAGSAEQENPSVDYLIHGSILDCAVRLEPADDGIGAVALGQLSSEVSMSFRATSAATGQVLFSTVEHSRISHRQTSRSGGPPDLVGSEDRLAVVRSAIRANVNKAIYRLVAWSDERPWTGKVVAVEDGRITIDAGFRQGLAEAMILHALVSGRDLIDPESGRILGSISEHVGRLQIVEVRENLAIAAVLDGCEGIRRGDRVELLDPPPVPIDRPPSARQPEERCVGRRPEKRWTGVRRAV